MMYLKNVGKRALALVLALMMCVGMLSTTAFAADLDWLTCKHTNSYRVNCLGVCDQAHLETWYCKDCDHDFTKSVGYKEHGHLGSTASNLVDGKRNDKEHSLVCTECHVIISIVSHSYSVANCTTPATCECGDVKGSKDPNNHANLQWHYNETSHWQECAACNNSGKVNEGSHNVIDGKCECGYAKTTEPPVDPTDKCEHGNNPAECLDCHMALGKHNYLSYYDTEATCTEDAVCKWDNCSFPGCNASYDQVLEGTKLDHSFTNYVSNNDATCVKDGTETAECDRCGATDTRTVADSKLEHDFFGKLVPFNFDGHVVYCVNGCGTHSEPVAHSFDITVAGHPNAVQATCQHMGIEVTQCKCGLEHYKAIEKLDHNYVDGKCTMCGKQADHECSFTVEGAIIREATCAQAGLKWYSCDVCGSSTAVEYEDWENHAGYHESVHVFATCEDNEKISYVCVGCGDTYDTTTPDTATGHTPNDPVEENRVAPQIGVPGSYDSVVYCDVCGKELSRTRNTIPALPGTAGGDVVIDDPDTPLGGGDEVELDDNAIPLAGPVTRAEFVDYLYRREGSPEAGLSTFEDVPADHEYAYAIGWGQANDIAYGVSATEFLPDELVTVGQAKLFLSRYAKLKGVEMPELAALVGLDDQDYAMNCDEILGEFFGSDE